MPYRTTLATVAIDSADGRELAADIYQQAILEAKESAIYRDAFTLQIPLCLGHRDVAERQAREWLGVMKLERSNDSSYSSWTRTRLKYLAGDIRADDLLHAAGENRTMLCYSYSIIGTVKLSDGDTEAARECFREAVSIDVPWLFPFQWSQAFLLRLERPGWPDWIEKKDSPAEEVLP